MGATVIIASRSEQRCLKTTENIKSLYPRSKGTVVPMPVDLSDLLSVRSFGQWFLANYQQLDILVNNGAINYVTNNAISTDEAPLKSKQGYDLCFASNYLGHFLLTDLLLPILRRTPRARILQISSNAQFSVDGKDLIPLSENKAPIAAEFRINDATHRSKAYGNSKLAQMLHAQGLQKILDQDNTTYLKV